MSAGVDLQQVDFCGLEMLRGLCTLPALLHMQLQTAGPSCAHLASCLPAGVLGIAVTTLHANTTSGPLKVAQNWLRRAG